MNAPEALKSNTREVYLCFSNLHDTHIPVGVGTRRSFLLSGPASGFDPRSVLSVRNFNKSPDYRRARFYSILSVIGSRLNPKVRISIARYISPFSNTTCCSSPVFTVWKKLRNGA
jgi:hypothetical protein